MTQRNGQISYALGLERFNIVKIAILPKQCTYRLNAILIELSTTFVTELEQVIKKFMWNHQTPRVAKSNPGGGGEGGETLPDFKQYKKLQYSEQCGTGTETDLWINGKEQRAQK